MPQRSKESSDVLTIIPDTIPIDSLLQNTIELIHYARSLSVQQVNLIQLITYHSIGRWIVEEQQQGHERAGYGKRIIQNLSDALTQEFGRGFSPDLLENTRKFYLNYSDRISETLYRKWNFKTN